MAEPKFPDVKTSLPNDNTFAIIATVSQALKRGGEREGAKEWTEAAFACRTREAVIVLAMDYVTVETTDGEDE